MMSIHSRAGLPSHNRFSPSPPLVSTVFDHLALYNYIILLAYITLFYSCKLISMIFNRLVVFGSGTASSQADRLSVAASSSTSVSRQASLTAGQ